MDHFDVAQCFIEQAQRSREPAELTGAFQRCINTLGFRYFACGAHVDPLRPRHAVMLVTYPKDWVRNYSEMGLHQSDPVFHRADRSSLPFFWDAPEFLAGLQKHARDVLSEGKRFGVEHGYTVPIHSPRGPYVQRASCSVVPDSTALDPRAFFALQLMAYYLLDAALRLNSRAQASLEHVCLTRRERQCLELVSQGKDDWMIGQLLHVSQRTVHNHIESAKRRLRVNTRAQAVVHALALQQISFGDILRAPHPDRAHKTRGRSSRT